MNRSPNIARTSSPTSVRHCLTCLVVYCSIQLSFCSSQVNSSEFGETNGSNHSNGRSFQLADILKNMPMNSDGRCVGISAVTEAMLDGRKVRGADNVEINSLAQKIYDSLATGHQVQFPARVVIDRQLAAVSDPVIIDNLSSLVTDIYKQEYLKMAQTQEGTEKLISAQNRVVRSKRQLDQILDADPDKVDLFCCFGARRFPDDTHEFTNHAVLIHKLRQGGKVVYDPNDPGAAQKCNLYEEGNELTIEWTCRYRDTGFITTQRYQIVHKEKFFSVVHGLESVE